MKFSIKDLVTFTEEILNGKLHFLCSVFCILKANWLLLPLLWIYHILLTIHYKYKRNGNEKLFANLLIVLLFCPKESWLSKWCQRKVLRKMQHVN